MSLVLRFFHPPTEEGKCPFVNYQRGLWPSHLLFNCSLTTPSFHYLSRVSLKHSAAKQFHCSSVHCDYSTKAFQASPCTSQNISPPAELSTEPPPVEVLAMTLDH